MFNVPPSVALDQPMDITLAVMEASRYERALAAVKATENQDDLDMDDPFIGAALDNVERGVIAEMERRKAKREGERST